MTPGPETRIKICGITNREDAEAAISFGAHALGFNLWPGSRRHIDLDREAGWIRSLPPFVSKIAVLVNLEEQAVRAVNACPFIDALQFHGDETPEWCRRFEASGKPFIKAIGVEGESSLAEPERFGTSNLLLDAHAPGTYGGTGKRVDWLLAGRFVREHPAIRVILSGGLTPDNVGEAIRTVNPYAVDVASGVESAPGKKDYTALRRFISEVRAARL